MEKQIIKTEPVLVKRFKELRSQPKESSLKLEFSSTFEDEGHREHLFQEAKKSFEFVFDKENFIHYLQLEPNKESFNYLKQIRRYGSILKVQFRFLDLSHQCGEQLAEFLSLLGKFNDGYWISPSQEIRVEILAKLNNIDMSVNFIDTLGFKEYARSRLNYVETLLQNTELTMVDFHSLRKGVRLFSNFLQVEASENTTDGMHWLFYSIFKLQMELGKIHDDFVSKGLKGEIDYSKSVVKVPPRIKDEFFKIKPFIEKVYGLEEQKLHSL